MLFFTRLLQFIALFLFYMKRTIFTKVFVFISLTISLMYEFL